MESDSLTRDWAAALDAVPTDQLGPVATSPLTSARHPAPTAASIHDATARVPAAAAPRPFPAARYALYLPVLLLCETLVLIARPT